MNTSILNQLNISSFACLGYPWGTHPGIVWDCLGSLSLCL